MDCAVGFGGTPLVEAMAARRWWAGLFSLNCKLRPSGNWSRVNLKNEN
jgi:hypothetical protein